MKSVRCATLEGFDAKVVDVEATITKGLPGFSIVGLASTSISEAKERVKSALLSNGFVFPPKKITINLAPSDIFKSGSHVDLSIALLIALHNQKNDFKEWFVFGELGLDGSIKDTNLIYPLILSLANQDIIKNAIVPSNSIEKLSKIPNISFFPFDNLKDVIEFFKDEVKKEPFKNVPFDYKYIEIDKKKYYYQEKFKNDFLDVKGQEVAKKAALISASGFHNILFEGSPGCGKSMIAKRIVEILPPLSNEEILEIAKIKTIANKDIDFQPKRPYNAPHHSATKASVFGGGSSKEAKIGEVGLAHLGELFFDELPHFSKNVLEALREPMQDGVINISRVNSKVSYKSEFLFVGAMNPCPCGNLLDEDKECRCSDLEIQKYKNRLSDPFLDRIDLHVVMQKVRSEDKPSYSSKDMFKMVLRAFRKQKQRGQKRLNGRLKEDEIDIFCILDSEAKTILDRAINNFSLSFRSINSIKKVSRTIADLEGSDVIKKDHIFEALSYRRR